MAARRGRLLLVADVAGLAGLYAFLGFMILVLFTCTWHTCGNHVPAWGWPAFFTAITLGGLYLVVLLAVHEAEPERRSRGMVCGVRRVGPRLPERRMN
jgi:MFS family permease